MCEANNNITFLLDEESCGSYENEFTIDDILQKIDDMEVFEEQVPKMINYNENYTVKELLLICEYYGIAKELKAKKCNKETIIQFLVDFESNVANTEIVFKRQSLWFYMNELKNDKFMKKYVLW
jgi:hypothetical protein